MKNYYQILGLTHDASEEQIKSAYKKLALQTHPDRGGNDELMVLINEAYKTLSDPGHKSTFDKKWQLFQETNIDISHVTIAGQIDSGTILPYSHSFREQYKSLLSQYEITPLNPRKLLEGFNPGDADEIYQLDEDKTNCIFQYIAEKAIRITRRATRFSPSKNDLSPKIILELFNDFLAGDYFGTRLVRLNKYLATQITKHKDKQKSLQELKLFEGIYEITSLANHSKVLDGKLLFSIKKITDFAKESNEETRALLIPLFYGKFFRTLFSNALLIYWNSEDDLFDNKLQQFDGQQAAKELYYDSIEQLSNPDDSQNSEHLIKRVRNFKLLYELEISLNQSRNIEEHSAADCREKAFNLLDWTPALIMHASLQIKVNFFLQIGIIFQRVANLETNPIAKMADEKLALEMYLTAFTIAQHSQPNVELYACIHVLKYLNNFQYTAVSNETISALQKRAEGVAGVFPFFEDKQSNISFFQQENNSISLMRQLLNSMVTIYEENKTLPAPLPLEHSAVTILYQAYEACLKNWYRTKFHPDLEYKFRLALMEELLAEKEWTFSDIEKNVSSPMVMVARNEEGWMNASKALPGSVHSTFEIFKSITGAELDYKTGETVLFLEQWDENSLDYEKAFTLFDVQEMLEKNLTDAFFSLDPVDPDRPYHPFNFMRFAPSQLHESELLNTMLLTDYILKFLTTGQEVQGKYPFDQRPIDQLISHFPPNLRKIINDFHQSEHSSATHRFWIEAEEVEILTDHKEDVLRIGLGEIKMVVKKHQMKRDVHGELKDTDNDKEGWPIYLLTSDEIRELKQGVITLEGHAMVFVHGENRVLFWKRNQILLDFIPKDFQDTLVKLFELPQEADGKIIQNSKNIPLLYQVTREISGQAGMSHRYSPEFIFAHEMTQHYDKLAQYIPEFGRLKQLSKLASVIRVLNNLRQENKNKIGAIQYLINPVVEPDEEAYAKILNIHQQNIERITLGIQALQQALSPETFLKKWQDKLQLVKETLGPPTVDENSPEVHKRCKESFKRHLNLYENPISGFVGGLLYPILHRFRVDLKSLKMRMAAALSIERRREQKEILIEMFSPLFPDAASDFYHGCFTLFSTTMLSHNIDLFLDGNIDPLANAIATKERADSIKEINKQFPWSTEYNTTAAMDGNENAVLYIADSSSRRQLSESQELKEKLEAGFTQIGFGKHQDPVDLDDKCLWLPASIRHEALDDEASSTRQLFFVYGGVNIQPKLNVTQQQIGPNGEHVRDGVTRNAATRYTAAQLNGGQAKIIPPGNRKEILLQERSQIVPTLKQGLHHLNPRDIKFTQPNVSPNFNDGKSVDQLINDLRSGKISAYDIKPIRVFQKDGILYSIDNRRLFAYNTAGIEVIPIKIVSLNDPKIALIVKAREDPIRKQGEHVIIVNQKQRNWALDILHKFGMIVGIHRGYK